MSESGRRVVFDPASAWTYFRCIPKTGHARQPVNRSSAASGGQSRRHQADLIARARKIPYGRFAGIAGSIRFDAREPDHLAPLLGFLSDELAEVACTRFG